METWAQGNLFCTSTGAMKSHGSVPKLAKVAEIWVPSFKIRRSPEIRKESQRHVASFDYTSMNIMEHLYQHGMASALWKWTRRRLPWAEALLVNQTCSPSVLGRMAWRECQQLLDAWLSCLRPEMSYFDVF